MAAAVSETPASTPQGRREGVREGAALRAAQAELAGRVAGLRTPAGRAAFVQALERWSAFADDKMRGGILVLATIDGDIAAGRAPPARPCAKSVTVAGVERGRAEARVAEASIAKAVFTRAAHLLRSNTFAGHERAIVLDTDEARCRLINACVEIDLAKDDPRMQFI